MKKSVEQGQYISILIAATQPTTVTFDRKYYLDRFHRSRFYQGLEQSFISGLRMQLPQEIKGRLHLHTES